MPEHNASMQDSVIEGISGIEFLTNGKYGDEFEETINGYMYRFSDEVVDQTFTLRDAWVTDANSGKSRAIEKQVAALLGFTHHHYDEDSGPIIVFNEIELEAVGAIYYATQMLLSAKKVELLKLYRGLGWKEKPLWWDQVHEGMLLETDDNRTLSSWSFSYQVAESFVRPREYSVIVRGIFPVDRIFAIINGYNLEYESVCISQSEQSEFEIITMYGGE